jgi:large subunit ribosomal protein L4
VVLERSDAVTWLSLRNAPQVHIVAVDQLNTYDVVASDDVVFTQGAYDAFVAGTASASERPATVVEPPADDAVVEDPVEAEAEPVAKKAATKKSTTKKSAAKAADSETADTETAEEESE